MTLKQIKDEIHNIKVIDLPFHSSGEDYDQLKTAINRLENIVNEYKPPTCASCKCFSNKVGCLNWQNLIFVKDEIKDNPNHFGCIYHSDYERKES